MSGGFFGEVRSISYDLTTFDSPDHWTALVVAVCPTKFEGRATDAGAGRGEDGDTRNGLGGTNPEQVAL